MPKSWRNVVHAVRFKLRALAMLLRRISHHILFLADRHWDTGELYINGTQVIAAGEIERFPVTAAKRQIGRGRSAVHDAAELFAVWVHDP